MKKIIYQFLTVLGVGISCTAVATNAYASQMRTLIDWQKSSETGAYPDLAKTPDLWFKVSLKHNRTYVYSGHKVIYTMYSTAGKFHKDPQSGKVKSVTPTGTFQAQPTRGDWVYNPNLKLGAKYYVSWNGNYLFHTVVTGPDHQYIKSEAAKLGKKPSSPGCVCLSVPDAKWLESSLPTGTKIVVDN